METVLINSSITFEAEGRLIQELGLRLVAKPEVALVELVKNAYDADSPNCIVSLDDDESCITIADSGHGMTAADFTKKWMRIGTSSKVHSAESARYHRKLTGAKGIGRFAIRYLGDHLELRTVAYDPKYQCKTRLSAKFDWRSLDTDEELSKTRIKYSVVKVPASTPPGTSLKVTQLRGTTDFTRSTRLRDEILRIVSPLKGLDCGPFQSSSGNRQSDQDPGFEVVLPGESGNESFDLATELLGNCWAKLTISLSKRRLLYKVWLPTLNKPKELEVQVSTKISKGFFADIRYFPKRAGLFQDKGIDGRRAWGWVRDNCGVKVVDHGFHIQPYGFPDNDWLTLDIDKSRSRRDWRTDIANKNFPVELNKRNDPKQNPVLYMPYNLQLVGAVFIESRRAISDEVDLIPSMDREGLLENEAFGQLTEYVRAGLEFLAHEDKAELDRQAALKAARAAKAARTEIRKAVEFIAQSPNLAPQDKTRLIEQYQDIAGRVDEQEEYSAQARKNLLTMGLLGVIAGFMTHESKAVIHELKQAAEVVKSLSEKHPSLRPISKSLQQRLDNFSDYLEYSRLFVQNVRSSKTQTLSAAGQIRHVLKRFKTFSEDRNISVIMHVPDDVKSPSLPVTVYSGILLNLYTNALKSVVAASKTKIAPAIAIRAWNEPGKHIIEVSDNGVGIPPEMRERIWDPLYTTTSDIGNPLGSGMGLGLTLVKEVLSSVKGKIVLLENPPPGFTTCFRVTYSIT